jgi:IclR family KDG regulon transcriptional repressor
MKNRNVVASPAHDQRPSPRTAVDKAIELLGAFPAGGETVGITELARLRGLSKSTVFRLLTIMERNGFVERQDGRYRLGRTLHELGARVYEDRPGLLQDVLAPFMFTLLEKTRHTVNLGLLHGTKVILLSRLHGHRSTIHIVRVGTRFASHSSSMGKALLARSPDAAEELLSNGLTALTPHTIVTADAFRADLHRIRQRGMATSNQEARPNLSCIAIALLDDAGRPMAALGMSGLSVTFDTHAQGTLRAVAADAERALRQALSR